MLRNSNTGHVYFGMSYSDYMAFECVINYNIASTWDLENAKTQNLQDLQDGKHHNIAMSRYVQVYGHSHFEFRILEVSILDAQEELCKS